MYILEPAKKTPVAFEADVCVVGGSCTGVFAAVRAARLGAKVIIIEKQNSFGGVATNGLVNIWHSLNDADDQNQVIAGLTSEVLDRLQSKAALSKSPNPSSAYRFNPSELKIELDKLVQESKITFCLHTAYAGIICDENNITHILIENKDGRQAVKAKFFIDATGDGDLARDLNIPDYKNNRIQPPSSCFLLQGDTSNIDLNQMIQEHGAEFGLDDDWGWSGSIPGLEGITMRADNHVFNVLCSRAEDLTRAEIEGRRQADSFIQMLNKYSGNNCALVATCAMIGIRDTVHYKTRFTANEFDLLTGKRYPNAVLNGTYRVDIHHSHDNGITFKYLDGRTCTYYGKSGKPVTGNWREENKIKGDYAKFYQLPLEILIQVEYTNFIPVGRMINADEGAFGALRVMVNLNQLGEAAGTAAYLSISSGKPIQEVDDEAVCRYLRQGGSAV